VARDLRDAAVKRFQITCERDPQIVAAFLGGSLAAGTADEVSDLDVYAVTREPDYAEFFTRRELFMQSWGRPVFLADTLNFEGLGFDMVHFVLDDGVNGELALGHTGNFRVLHGGAHKVLVDKIGLLDSVTFPLYVPSESQRRQQVEHALKWFWLDFIQLAKHAQRKNEVTAVLHLTRLRSQCVSLLQIAGAVALVNDVSTFSTRLASSTAIRDLDDLRTAALAIADVHRDLGTLVGKRFGCDYPVELAAVAREKLNRQARSL
jgi:Nucleotidyltransferase domain